MFSENYDSFEPGTIAQIRDHVFHIHKYPISLRRVITSVRVAVVVAIASLVVLLPTVFWFIHPAVTPLVPIVAGMSAGGSHFLGSNIRASAYILYSGIVGFAVCFASQWLLIGPYYRWIGCALITFWSFVIPAINSIGDPGHSRITVVKLAVLDMLFVLVFNDFQTTSIFVPSLQMFLVHVFAFVACLLGSITLPTSITRLPDEQSVILFNCAILFDRLVHFLRDPVERKETEAELEDADPAITTDRLFSEEKHENAERLVKEMQKNAKKVNHQFELLRIMVKEAELESTWVAPEILKRHQGLFERMDLLRRHMASLRQAIESGFVYRLSETIINPIEDDLHKLHMTVGTYLETMAYRVDHTYDTVAPFQRVLWWKKLKRISHNINDRYYEIIGEMQHSNQLKPVPTSDVVRLHFFLWRVLTIRDFLKAIDIEIALLRAEVCHDNSWRFWRSRWGAIIWTFTGLFMIGRHMIDYGKMFQGGSSIKKWLRNGHWKFPFRYAIGMGAGSAIAVAVNLHVTVPGIDLRPVWAIVTLCIVMVPSLGVTITRGVHRLIGSAVGGGFALVARIAVGAANASQETAGVAVMMPFTLFFVFISTYFQHAFINPRPYSWVVATFTFQVIAFAGYPYIDGLSIWWLAPIRVAQVFIGDILAILASLLFWERSTTALKKSLKRSTKDMTEAISELFDTSWTAPNRAPLDRLHEVQATQLALRQEAELELTCARTTWKRLSRITKRMVPILFVLDSMYDVMAAPLPKNSLEFTKTLFPIIQNIRDMLVADAIALKHYLEAGEHPRAHQYPLLEQQVKLLDKQHRAVRRQAVQLQVYHTYEMLRFNAYIYSVREFIDRWRDLMSVIPVHDGSKTSGGCCCPTEQVDDELIDVQIPLKEQ